MRSAVVIRAPAGLGKTVQAARLAAACATTVEFYVPTHKLAEELANVIRGFNPTKRVTVIGGRGHIDTTGKQLCQRNAEAEQLSNAGIAVFPTLCDSVDAAGVKNICPLYNTCGYIDQYRSADVFIYTHAHLPLMRSRLNEPLPGLAVIDESFFQSCIRTTAMSLGDFAKAIPHVPNTALLQEIYSALVLRAPLLAHVKNLGLKDEVTNVRKKLESLIKNATSPKQLANSAPQAILLAKELAPALELLRALGAEIVQSRDFSQTIVIQADNSISVHRRLQITRFGNDNPPHWMNATPTPLPKIVILDANADQKIIGQFFNIEKFHTLRVQRQAHVTQCISTRGSTTSLTPSKNTDLKSKRAAVKRLEEIQRLIDRKAQNGAKVLVVGPQIIVGNAARQVPGLLLARAGVKFTHFGGLRGIDKWKDFDVNIIIGRNQPTTAAVEDSARAIWGAGYKHNGFEEGDWVSVEYTQQGPRGNPVTIRHEDWLLRYEKLDLSGSWTTTKRAYQTVDGQPLGVDVVTHADPLVNLLLEQIRESESMQAIDRLRLVHAENPKEIILLSNIPLDVEVDELLTWTEIMQGSPFADALSQTAGTLPLTPEWLAKRFPLLWKTRGAAKDDVKKIDKEGGFTNKVSISKLPLFVYAYRPVGQKSFGRFLSIHSNPSRAAKALEQLLGVKVITKPLRARP